MHFSRPGSIIDFMSLTIQRLERKEQTGERMYRLASQFADDLWQFQENGTPLPDLSPEDFFSLVSSLPYRQDDHNVEIICRPLNALLMERGLDCKKKSILIGAYAHLNEIPFQFVAVSTRPDGEIHHVYPELKFNNEWVKFDATYPKNQIGVDPVRVTERDILPRVGSGVVPTRTPVLVEMSGNPSDFNEVARQLHGVQMGAIGTVLAIVSAVATVSAATIGAVAAKRRQTRQHQHDIAMSQKIQAEKEAAQQAIEADSDKTIGNIAKIAIPALVIGGSMLL